MVARPPARLDTCQHVSGPSLFRYASWCAYANGAFAVAGFAFIAAFLAAGGPFHFLSDLAFFASALALVPIPWVLHQLGHTRVATLSLFGTVVGLLGALGTAVLQASVLLKATSSEQQSAPITIAFGAIGVWMIISNHLARADGTLPSGLAWLGVIAGVGLVLAAVVLGLQGFRTSDPAALPHADPLTGLGLTLSVIAHLASLTWAIWLGRALRDVGRLVRPAAAASRA